jgi:BatD DUF11 like domain
MYRLRIPIAVLLGALIAVAGDTVAFADSLNVTAVLTSSETVLGEPVQLQIRVTGARSADAPDEIVADGLEIHRTGTSQHFEMNNFNVTSSVVYDYTVMPLKAGTFTIPPQRIRVGGNALSTPALRLNVADSPGRSSASRPSQGAHPGNPGKLVFAELIVPKKTAFVGEVVPVQIRLGFDPRAYPKLTDGPEITGQGFTAQKLQQSGENEETVDGRVYHVVTFKTAIAAARAGKFEIGPVKAKAQVMVARSRRSPRARSPFDLFNMDDPFSDPFFANPFSQFGERREVEINSDPVALEVKPLPPSAPPGFSGAIGNFTMTTDAKPKSVQVGDPITVTSTILGRGNFDRVGAPVIDDERGWHKYPPSSKFAKDDEVGISGTKTFETVLSPNEKKQSLPVMEFAYFDPVKEQYATLRSDPIAINVEGGAVAAASPVAVPQVSPRSSGVTPAKPRDILYQLTERPKAAQSFTPLYARPTFWSAQLIPLLALLGLIGWQIRQARIDNRAAQRIAALQHEAAELMRKLHRSDASPREYYAEASRVVRVKAALASGSRQIDPNTVDVDTAAETFRLNGDSRERLRRLFEQCDELQYSGAHNGSEKLSPEIRQDVLEFIETLRA